MPPKNRPKAHRHLRRTLSTCPENSDGARQWIQGAFREGCYSLARHFDERLKERNLTLRDVRHVIERPIHVEPYTGMPQQGGSCWRVSGHALDFSTEIRVGVEAYLDSQGHRIILCTLFPAEVKR